MTIVYKFGTNCIFNERKELDYETMKEKAREIRSLDYKPVIMASGAIAFGKLLKNEKRTKLDPHERASYSSIGEPLKMDFYRECFEPTPVAQILVTYNDLKDRNHLNRTIRTNMHLGVITILNMNDAIYYGETGKDNDIPSALVAIRIGANYLMIFGRGYDGFMMDGKLVERIYRVEKKHYDACKCSSLNGTGGFKPKLKAGQIMGANGKHAFISNINNSIESVLKGTAKATLIGKYSGDLDDLVEGRVKRTLFKG